MATTAEKRIVTPKFRVSFPNVFKPGTYNGKTNFSLSMIWPKDTDLTALKKACVEVARAKFGEGTDDKIRKKTIKMPFHSGEEKDLDGYDDDCTWANAKSVQKPGIVGTDGKTVIEVESDFYAGCYARATVVPYAYDKDGSKGVALGLRNLQFMGHGEPFTGSSDPSEDFDAVEGVEANDSSGSDDMPF